MDTQLILIGGVSRSGKSTLAAQLTLLLPNAIHLDQDQFVLPKSLIPKIKDRTDWESPKSIDWDLLTQKVASCLASYEYVIIEGIFAFHNPDLNHKANLLVYLELEETEFNERRKEETRWGEEPDWYLDHVWTTHNSLHPESLAIDIQTRYSTQLAEQIAQSLL